MKLKHIMYILCFLCSGCTLDIPLEDQFSDPDAITDISSARSLLASAYEALPQHIFELSILSDDFYPSSKLEKDALLQNLYGWRETELTDFAETCWTGYYAVVATVNALLARMDAVVTLSDEEVAAKTVIVSRAKALKAMCYFDLLRLFAPSYAGNEEKDGIILKDRVELDFLPRSPMRECVAEIRRLLTEAQNAENTPDEVYWLSDKAVTYLLTELELYAENYPAVLALTDNLLTDYPEGTLQSAAYTALWSSNESTARIFAKYQLTQIYQEIRYNTFADGDYLVLNDELAYEDGDIRKAWSAVDFVMDGNRDVRLFGKYNRMNRDEIPGRYVNYCRAAGLWLMRAEAFARSAQPEKAESLMNRMLTQRGAALLPADLKGEALIDRILEERRKEFVGEGIRWFDMKRCGMSVKRFGIYGSRVSATITPDDYRWTLPLPASEYRYNENVTQNEGWTVLSVQ